MSFILRASIVLAFVFAFFVQVYSQDACQALYGGNEISCLSNSTCTWCKCAAVPSTCVTVQDARKLPPGVFTCGNGTRSDCGTATTNETCTKNVGCSWCSVSSSLSNLRTMASSSCVNYATASKLPAGSCTGPY